MQNRDREIEEVQAAIREGITKMRTGPLTPGRILFLLFCLLSLSFSPSPRTLFLLVGQSTEEHFTYNTLVASIRRYKVKLGKWKLEQGRREGNENYECANVNTCPCIGVTLTLTTFQLMCRCASPFTTVTWKNVRPHSTSVQQFCCHLLSRRFLERPCACM